MDKLANTIEAILFASGNAVPIADMAEKLGVTEGAVKKALAEIKETFGVNGGILLLEFNKKAQFASNPNYKEEVAAVLNPIREKELTRTVLECAAIIAYKQPITRTEIELIRGANSDYAVRALLDLNLIYPCGRKDAVGRPILFATTDEFLKRFRLDSLEQLPDYDELMAEIAKLSTDEKDSYLYARDEYTEEGTGDGNGEEDGDGDGVPQIAPKESKDNKDNKESKEKREEVKDGYEIPDFLHGLDEEDIVKIS